MTWVVHQTHRSRMGGEHTVTHPARDEADARAIARRLGDAKAVEVNDNRPHSDEWR